MYKEDRMPANIKVEQVGRLLYVILPNTDRLKTIGYARVSSHDLKGQLKTQEERLWAYAGRNKIILDDVVSEVASGLDDNRKKLNSLLSDPDVGYILVEHRERLARFGVNMIDAALKSRGGGVIVIDDAEIEDDLMRDMTDVLTSFCARLYDKRSARNRAKRAMEAVR
jgi:putative resolvase